MGWGSLVTAALNGLRVMFGTRLGLWIASAMAWIGISFGSMKLVLDPMLNELRAHAAAGGSGSLAGVAQAWLGVLRFDQALTIVLGAYAARHAISATKLFLQKRT